MNICVLIPSFNEEKTIGWLVRTVRGLGYDMIVIDDGSKDNTAKIARDHGAEVLVNEHNLGKGASLRRAFDLAVPRDYDAVIIMDADGQHLPSDIAPFVECFQKKARALSWAIGCLTRKACLLSGSALIGLCLL